MGRLARRLPVLCLLLPLLAGCWDGLELEQRALVLMVAIDGTDTGVRVSLQLARPQTMAGSSGETSGSQGGEPVTVVTRAGKDVAAAIQAIQLSVDRELFFGHVRVVILSEEIGRRGAWAYLEPLVGGSLSVPRTAWLFVVRGAAEKVLSARPALDRVPSTYLSNFFETRLLLERPYDVTVGGFHQRWVTPGEEPVAIWISALQEDQSAPELLGVAAFKGDSYQGGLEREESLGWILTQNQRLLGRLSIACPDGDGYFAVRFIRSSIRLRPEVSDGKLTGVAVVGSVSGRIGSAQCQVGALTLEGITQYERAFRAEIERLVSAAFVAAQAELDSDIIGFGKAVYRFAHPHWTGDADWAERFADLRLRVAVNACLDHNRTYTYAPRD